MQLPQTENQINAPIPLRPHSLALIDSRIAALNELLATEALSEIARDRALGHLLRLFARRRQILEHWRAAR